MLSLLKSVLAYSFLALLVHSCHSQNHNHTGKLVPKNFIDEVEFDETFGLVILPVVIEGNTYRFLFDTGAPNAISKDLQNELHYKVVHKEGLRDSENIRRVVEYVRINQLTIGEVEFRKMNAFVADFDDNPTISCLEIDGIIGSPLMRHCIWQINYDKQTVTITDQPNRLDFYEESEAKKVKFDKQYSIVLTSELEGATMYNLKLDYGSTNAITITNKSMEVLEEHDLLPEPARTWTGYSQSGLHGSIVKKEEKEINLDCEILNASVSDARITSGHKDGGLIGTEILREYIVTLDYPSRLVHLSPLENRRPKKHRRGFTLGRSKGLTKVFSIEKGGPAEMIGLKPADTLISIDDYPLGDLQEFCDFATRKGEEREFILMSFYKNGKVVSDTLRLNRVH